MTVRKPLVRIDGGVQQLPAGDVLPQAAIENLVADLAGKVADDDTRLTDSREWTADTVTQAEAEAGTATARRAWTAQRVRQAIVAWWAASAEKTKLDGIAAGATANSSDATLLARANHTGTQAISTVSGLQVALNGKEPTITAGTAADFWRGDKTWQNFGNSTRAQVLTGLGTPTNTAIAAADTILAAFAKLQGQVTARMANPMTAAGDMIRGGASGAPVRVAAGTNGHVWTMVAGVPAWAAPAGGSDVWLSKPIGEPFPIWDHIAGVPVPPTDNAGYRYIKLTASDAYNSGVLTSEAVSGSAPLVQATAVVNDSASPMNGQPVRLINTEARFVRAGSSGTVAADAFQGHRHASTTSTQAVVTVGPGSYTAASTSGGVVLDPTADGTNGTPRTANETRPKYIGASFYMRIR